MYFIWYLILLYFVLYSKSSKKLAVSSQSFLLPVTPHRRNHTLTQVIEKHLLPQNNKHPIIHLTFSLLLDSTCEHPCANISHNRGQPTDLQTSSSQASCHRSAGTREKTDEEPLNLKDKAEEKKRHRSCHTDTTQDSRSRDKSLHPDVTPEFVSRKRQLQCDSFVNAKRAKLAHARPSSHVQHINLGVFPAFHSNSSRCYISYPGTDWHPYKNQTASSMWDMNTGMDFHFRQSFIKNCLVNTHKLVRIPQRQKDAFLTPPLYFPSGMRQQETVYLTGRETFRSSPWQMPTPSYYLMP